MTCPTCRARGERPRYSTPYRPIDWSDSPHLARLRRLMGDGVSLERAWFELSDPRNRPTPQATIEAVLHVVRERGRTALKEPAIAKRIETCNAIAKAEIEQRIARLKDS